MNVHQPIFPTITTIVPNVSILGTQAMNPSIGHTTTYMLTIRQPSHNLLHQSY
jgi:hypothetical protein